MKTVLDFETTIKNKGHALTPENFLVSYSLFSPGLETEFHYYKEPDFLTCLRARLEQTTELILFNANFELLWLLREKMPLPRKIWDGQIAEFVYSGQALPMYENSLSEALKRYGLGFKPDEVASYWEQGIDTPDIPIEVLREYNNSDVENEWKLYCMQQELLDDKLKRLVTLQGFDAKTLARAQFKGIKFNVEQAKADLAECKEQLEESSRNLLKFVPEEVRQYFNWDSGDDLSLLLYGGEKAYEYRTEEESVYKSGPRKGETYQKGSWHTIHTTFPKLFNPVQGTEVKKTRDDPNAKTRFFQVDEPTLKQLKTRNSEAKRAIELLLGRAKTAKVAEMLEQFLSVMETKGWDGSIHGQFNQVVARTGRLSSSSPNVQNTSPQLDKLLVSRYV